MFGLITKKKLLSILSNLNDSQDESKAIDVKDFHWRCGNANAINYICRKLNMDNPLYVKRRSERGGEDG